MFEHLHGLRIGVTGGAGFIGSHLVELLSMSDVSEIVVVDDVSTGTWKNIEHIREPVTRIEGDICDSTVARRLGELDLVFHLAVRNVRASIRDPQENLRVNADGTLEVLEAMRHGARGAFVYVSSSEVYGIPEAGSFSEAVVPMPTTVYGAGKLAGEHLANAYHKTYGLDTRVVRPFNNYGPRSHFEGDSGEVIPKFILRSLKGAPLLVHGDGSQTRDFMFVEESARWIAEIAGVPELKGMTVNIGTGTETSILDLADMVVEATGSSSDVVLGDPRPGDLPRLVADTRLIESIIPFHLRVDLEAGLARTIDFFRHRDLEEMLALEIEVTWT